MNRSAPGPWPLATVLLLTLTLSSPFAVRASGGGGGGGGGGGECETEHVEDLEPGQSRSGVTGQAGCPGPVFLLQVPSAARHLTFTSSGGTGNVDLYARLGSQPTTAVFDRSSTGPGNGESVIVESPASGAWYVRLNPAASFSGVTLVASYEVDAQPIGDDDPQHDLGDDHGGEFTYFEVAVPPQSVRMDVTTDGGTGNVDLYVAFDAPPTPNSPLRSTAAKNKEGVVILSPQGGRWIIGLRANVAYAGVTLLVHIAGDGACVPTDTNHCLLGGRFGVDVVWKNQHAGGVLGVGHVKPDSDQTGLFWFFDAANVELVVKVLDGRPVNGKFWVFYGGLTDVEFDLQVVDGETGQKRLYHHAPGSLLGLADTAAFPVP